MTNEMFYHEEIKREFIKRETNNNSKTPKYVFLVRHFKQAKEYEEIYGCDIYDWGVTQITNYYKSMFSCSLTMLLNVNNNFKNYTSWALINGMVKDKQNHYDEISNELLNTCINHGLFKHGIFSRSVLLKNIERFNNPSDQFLTLGLFEGLGGVGLNDFWRIELSDFKIKDNKIYVVLPRTDRELQISDKLYQYAEEAVNTYEYIPMVETEGKTKEFKKDDPCVIKSLWNTHDDIDNNYEIKMARRMLNKLVRITEVTETPYNRVGLHESGRIDFLKARHIEGESWNDTINNNKEELEYRYGKMYAVKRWLVQYRQYLEQ